MKNIKPIFEWAKLNGDASVIDRIVIKLLPAFIQQDFKITSQLIESSENIEVSDELYELILSTAQELVGSSFKELSNV